MKITKDMALILLCLAIFITGVFGSAISINNSYATYTECQAVNKAQLAKIDNGTASIIGNGLYDCTWAWKFKPALAPEIVEAFEIVGIAAPIILLGWAGLSKPKKKEKIPESPYTTEATG